MSVFDIDRIDEKIDYEVLIKKRFEEIENDIRNIQWLCSVGGDTIYKLSDDINFLKNEVFKLNDFIYNIRDNIEVLRTTLNQLLPENQQIFFKDIF